METHVVCYVTRNKITDWKRLVLTHETPSFIYGSNDERVFVNHLKDGGMLWVISSIPGRPPELVARLKVKAVLSINDPKILDFGVTISFLCHFSAYKWIAIGEKDSVFFGHNNAGTTLLNTVFETTKGDPILLDKDATSWSAAMGKKLQRPTKLYNKGFAHIEYGKSALNELASTKDHSIFISWKWSDYSKDNISTLAYSLADNGFMVWLDLLALPRAKALKKIQKDKKKLESLLKYGYQQCIGIIAVDSENYGHCSKKSERNWTLREWQGELDPDKKMVRILFQPGDNASKYISTAPKIQLSSKLALDAGIELKNKLIDTDYSDFANMFDIT